MNIKPQLFGNWNGHFLKWTVLFLGLTNRLTCSILECIFRNGHSYSVPGKIWDLWWMELLICTYSLWNYDCKNLHVYFGPLHQSLGLHIFQIGSKATTEIKKNGRKSFCLTYQTLLHRPMEKPVLILKISCWLCGNFGSSLLLILNFAEIQHALPSQNCWHVESLDHHISSFWFFLKSKKSSPKTKW